MKGKMMSLLMIATMAYSNLASARVVSPPDFETEWAVKCTARDAREFTLVVAKKQQGVYESYARWIQTSGSVYDQIEKNYPRFNPEKIDYGSIDKDRYLDGGIIVDFAQDVGNGRIANFYLRAESSVKNYSLNYREFGKETRVLIIDIQCEYR